MPYPFGRIFASLLLLSGLLIVAPARATPVIFTFTGSVLGSSVIGPASLPQGVFPTAPIVATLRYDSASVGEVLAPNVMFYPLSDFDLSIVIGANLWQATAGGATIGTSTFLVEAGAFTSFPNAPAYPGATQESQTSRLFFGSNAPDFLPDLLLPTAPFDLSLSGSHSGSIIGESCGCFGPGGAFAIARYEIDFSIDGASGGLVPVTEPGTLALFASGLLLAIPLIGRRVYPARN